MPVARLSPEDREYVHIPLHDALLAAGGGALNSSEEIIDHLTFRADWLQGIGVSPSHARLGRASGLSMFPTIDDRDLVLMDVSKREPPVRRRPNGDTWKLPIYSFLDDGEARVKRIDRPESDLLILVSDNRDYPPEVRSGSQLQDLNIIGKVKWWAHTIRE